MKPLALRALFRWLSVFYFPTDVWAGFWVSFWMTGAAKSASIGNHIGRRDFAQRGMRVLFSSVVREPLAVRLRVLRRLGDRENMKRVLRRYNYAIFDMSDLLR